jgi:hypothetical protein
MVISDRSSRPRPFHSTTRDCRGSGPASGHCFTVKTTSFISPTSPPLLKCANHQVYHLVHMC